MRNAGLPAAGGLAATEEFGGKATPRDQVEAADEPIGFRQSSHAIVCIAHDAVVYHRAISVSRR